MQKFQDIFGPGSNLETRIVRDYDLIARRVAACRELGLRVVLASGSYDLWHEGHARYLERARQHGDVVIIGVDDDEKVRRRKGPDRPYDIAETRMELLCHSRHVDLVFLKRASDEKWQLIKTVRPDVLIATQSTYTEEDIAALREYCKEIAVLPPQAATSTTAKIRLLLLGPVTQMEAKAQELLAFIQSLKHGGRG